MSFFHFFVKKVSHCFLIRERVVIFALDFPTDAIARGGSSKFFE